MKVFVKNRFTLARGSKVLDENGKEVLKVKGKMLSARRKKQICDLDGKVLYRVQNKFWSMFLPSSYMLTADKKKIGRLVRKLGGKSKYVLQDFPDEISLDGGFFSGKVTVMRKGEPIGSIKAKFAFINDKFEVEGEEADIPFLVALTIAMDNIRDRGRS